MADLRNVQLPEEKPVSAASLEAQLFDLLLQGMELRDAIETLVNNGEKKNAVKAAALHLKEYVDA